MNQYIVYIKYIPRNVFDNGKEKFIVNANSEIEAKENAKKHPLFPFDGEIIKIKYVLDKRK